MFLSLLFAVVVSCILARPLPLSLPRPLVQIALGAVVGLVANWRVTLDPGVWREAKAGAKQAMPPRPRLASGQILTLEPALAKTRVSNIA